MKKWIRPRRIEWASFFIMMPVIAVLLNYILFGPQLWNDYRVWLYSFTFVYFQGMASWYVHIAVMHWLRIRFPHIHQTTKRLVILGISHLFLTSFTFAMIFIGYDLVGFLGYRLNVEDFKLSLLLAIALNMIATSLWEADYTFNKWKESLAEKEKLQQLTINHEFETLKSQVNPHFLFNCFNTLSSLISEDRAKAEIFLDELSKVYRYLLRNNKESMTTLQTEVKFIESYYRLLQTRHGEAVQLKIDIDKKYEQYMLPTLSLQLLVENVVKHNVVSKSQPLLIDIFTTSGKKLVVTNNLQSRIAKLQSNKVGLENIRSKYELIGQPGFQVLQDSKSFSVVLPLIWNKVFDKQLHAIEL